MMTATPPIIRAAGGHDADAIWAILEPVVRGGETYTLPRDMTRQDALCYWLSPAHHVFVAGTDGEILAVLEKLSRGQVPRQVRFGMD